MRIGDARPEAVAGRAANWADERLTGAGLLRKTFNKIFPDHWSFMLGEIALYSFIVLLLTGTFLAMFFTPSHTEIVYHGSYVPLDGVRVSDAYNSTVRLSFDVRGGLLIRQMHHWAANVFMAAILLHMLRIFFTGAFRKPRESNFVIGLTLWWLGVAEGFAGYSLPDDGLSGTGLRIAYSVVESIPLIGSWAAFSMFDGEFPGDLIYERLYIVHVFLIPGLIAALIALHLALVVKLKHTQWPGPGRTERNVVGTRMVPSFALNSTSLFLSVFAIIAFMGGLVQINPIWLWGPYESWTVKSNSQPDWYVMFLEGTLRAMPPWAIRVHVAGHGYTVPPVFWAAVFAPAAMAILAYLYPALEKRFRRDHEWHNLLERPRDNPGRTALGAMALSFYLVLTLNGGNDTISQKFHINLNAMVWIGRFSILLIPPIVYYLTRRICLGLQQHDRELLAEGVETGVVVQLPNGNFTEVHQPLGHTEDDKPLPYRGAPVPKKMNQIGASGRAIKGFFFPVEPIGPSEERGERPPAEITSKPEDQ